MTAATPTRPVRAALYARVSTRGKGQDPELQLADLRRVAEQRGWSFASEYTDIGISGSKDRRPELDRMMADARAGRIDVVAVWRFDRFARSVQHLVAALNEFRTLGVEFLSLHEQIDTNVAMGRAMFHVIAAMAELERELIRERVQAGVDRARLKGKVLGRRPNRVMDVAMVSEMFPRGVSLRGIARETGLPLTSVRRATMQLSATPPGAAEIR